eukprot:5344995-Pleurochrysis_carterae.AAC.6
MIQSRIVTSLATVTSLAHANVPFCAPHVISSPAAVHQIETPTHCRRGDATTLQGSRELQLPINRA